jgi:hypothetical protein
MSKFRSYNNAGPWKFSPQGNKFAYINNPRWTPQMAHQDDHEPCGYWYKEWSPAMPYLIPDGLPIWEPSAMCMDEEARKIYTTCVYNYVGQKFLRGVFETDIDTFRHTRFWSCEGRNFGPASEAVYFRDYFLSRHVWWRRDQGDKYLIPVSHGLQIDLLNARTNTIRQYDMTIGTGNTTHSDIYAYFLGIIGGPGEIYNTKVDEANQRLYVWLLRGYAYMNNYTMGFFDLTEQSPPYTWHVVRHDCHARDSGQACHPHRVGDIRLNEGQSYASGGDKGNILFTDNRLLLVGSLGYKRYDISPTGVWQGQITRITSPNLGPADLLGNNIYAVNSQGLHTVSMNSTSVQTFIPSYSLGPTYGLRDICVGSNGRIYINHAGKGIGEFNPSGEGWRLLTDWELLGPTPWVRRFFEGVFSFGIVYDDRTKCVFSGFGNSWGRWDRGPWNSPSHPDHMNLQWMPQGDNWWGLYIARHSVQPTPPPDQRDDLPRYPSEIQFDVPMIWTMPNTK